jgi:D-glycero-D-manno-heptose 1,7-bisphosphate phosphatase
MTWAVFLDRDGTIVEEVGYLHDPRQLVLIDGAAEAVRLLNEAGVPVLLAVNQAGIGRGYYTQEEMWATQQALEAQLAAVGVRLDGFYFCPHHPDAGCDCRKPQPGMLLRAAEERGIDLQRSFMIGDKLSDLQAGRRAGCRTVLVQTGYGQEAQQACRASGLEADYVSRDLLNAVRWILARQTGEAGA